MLGSPSQVLGFGQPNILRVLEMPLLRLRNIGPGCLGLLLASGLCLWLARDRLAKDRLATELPRRAVATVLADRLGARVRVDRLEILGRDRFLLTGVSMTELRDYPFIEALGLEQLVVEGSLKGVLDNRFDRLRLRGLDVHLAPAAAPPPPPPDRPLPRIDELIIEPASIRVERGTGADDLVLCLEAIARNLGTQEPTPEAGPKTPGFAAEVVVNAAELDLHPLYALLSAAPPDIEAQAANLTVELATGAGGTRLAASAERATLARGGGHLELQQPRVTASQLGPVISIDAGSTNATARLDGRLATAAKPSVEVTVTESTGGELRIGLVPRIAWLAGGHLVADWDPARPRPRHLEARFRGLDLERLWPDSGLEATASGSLHATGDRLEYRLELRPEALVTGNDRQLSGLQGSTVRVTGSLPFNTPTTAVPDNPGAGAPLAVEIEVPTGRGRWDDLRLPPQAFPLAASFDGRWLGDPSCAGAARPCAYRFSGDYRLASSAAGRLAADGEVTLRGDQASADLNWAWTGIELERLLGALRSAGLALPAFAVAGICEARGHLRGPVLDDADLRGTLRVHGLEANAETVAGIVRWSGADATASWSRTDGGPIEVLSLTTTGTLSASGIAPLDLELVTSGRLESDLSAGRLESTLRESPDHGTGGTPGSAHLTGGWRRRSGSALEASGRISLKALDLARWQTVAQPLAEAEALAGYRLEGSAGAELEATLTGGAWNLTGPVRLESAGFTSLDGSQVAQGLAGTFDLDLHGASPGPIEATGSGRVGGFLLLWNTFFGDFSAVEASLAARARLEPAGTGPRPWYLEVDTALPDGPIVETTFERRGDGWRYTLSLDDTDLAATHERYLAPLLAEQLGGLELGGKLAARLRGSYRPGEPASWSLIGGIQAQDLHAASGGGQAAVSGLDLDLPLHLRRSRAPAGADDSDPGLAARSASGPETGGPGVSGPRLAGRLAFERLAVRGLELPPTESDLAVEADSVGLEKPLVLSVLGGAVTLERLTLRQLLRSSRHLESGIGLSGIRLEKISDELGLIPLEGALDGSLHGVRLSPSRLSVDGGGTIKVFDGTVEVRDISGQDVLSRFPKLQLSADFRDLDLGALTRRLDFGEMTGILQGTLEDLELFRGVPVRFSARLETLHREGVPRTIDVKAVNNITILSTGQRAGMLDRGIQKFFDRYTYERLGVTLRLDRDVLLLRGLERRGDKELFLRGRLPFRIDVVNAQPGKTVSFQTMVGRLKSMRPRPK